MPDPSQALQSALEHHHAGRRDQAEQIYQQILQSHPRHPYATFWLGALFLEVGRTTEALALARQAVSLSPENAYFHYGLGDVERVLGHDAEARACYEIALRLNPALINAHTNLGVVLQKMQLPAEAEAHYREVIRLMPDNVLAWHNLGTVLLARGERDEARTCLEQALKLAPAYADAHNTLGSLWQRSGDLARSRAYFEQAVRLKRDHVSANFNLGVVYYLMGQLEPALSAFRRAAELRPDFVEAHLQCGAVLNAGQQFAQAETCLERALQLRPDYVPALGLLASVLEYRGRTREARAALEKALAAAPSSALRIRSALLLPVIYESKEAIHRERARLEKELADVARAELEPTDPAACGCPFFLAYQGLNDRDVMRTLAGIYERAIPSLRYVAPHCMPGAARHGAGQPIRVGFLSRFFFRHTMAKLNAGFIRHLTRPDFRVTLIRFPGHDDDMARALQQSADRVLTLPGNLEDARRLIADERLDVLVYTDIGMDPVTYLLAFACLAPVQCAAWGHPVTTGLATIDYFLSSKLLEPADADEHYTEKLIRLESVNTCYTEPTLPGPAKSRSDLGLPETGHLYVCTQTLYKLHPEFDAVISGILRGDPNGWVILLAGADPHWKELLVERFRRGFPDRADRVLFLPSVSQDDFLHLQALADVLLDTFPFGGGNTTLEALAFGTPVVTLPGAFLRGRITSACYQQMGVTDCIASSTEDYVRIALRLGMDPEWRQEIREQILARKHVLYDNQNAVRELETFLKQAVANLSSPV